MFCNLKSFFFLNDNDFGDNFSPQCSTRDVRDMVKIGLMNFGRRTLHYDTKYYCKKEFVHIYVTHAYNKESDLNKQQSEKTKYNNINILLSFVRKNNYLYVGL